MLGMLTTSRAMTTILSCNDIAIVGIANPLIGTAPNYPCVHGSRFYCPTKLVKLWPLA